MNFEEVRTIVRDYISDVTADVDQHILDAVNFLSFVFSKKKIDETQTTVKDQTYISKPDNCLKVLRIEIDGDEVPESDFKNLENAEDEETLRWFEFNEKIQLTNGMDEDGETIKIWFVTGYHVDSGGDWLETQPGGDINSYWHCVASDSDGSNLVAGINNGRLYISSDGGATWTETRPSGDVDDYWYCVASDSDGSNLIVGASNGRLYTSSDSGVTWTERQPAGAVDKAWRCVASDSDGSNLIAGAYTGRLYTSSDSGVTWTERQPAGNVDQDWYSVASSSDGSNLIAGASSGRLYVSSDSGVTWTESGVWNVDLAWRCVASDSDGSNLIAGINDSRLFIFSNDLEIDVDDNLGELVYVGAAYRHYRKIVSTKVISPATYPDIELDEVRKVLDQWRDDYYTLLKEFVKFN